MAPIEQVAMIVSQATRGYCRVYRLVGPSNSAIRQAIMSLLIGKKLPKSACGITVLVDELAKQLGSAGLCRAYIEDDMAEKLRAIVAGLTPAIASQPA